MADDETPEEAAWRRAIEWACGRDVCWLRVGHDGPCEPGGRPHPDEETRA